MKHETRDIKHRLQVTGYALRASGFTLIEVLVAGFIMTLGAGGAFALIQQSISFTSNAAFQFEASYLAQEGLEIARNIRDTNLLKIHKGEEAAWTDGLTGCEAGCGAGYLNYQLWDFQADEFLNIEANGFYGYGAGAQTPYKRKIIVTQPSADELLVEVEVTWEERGRSHMVEAATQLHNWLPEAP